MNNGQFGNNTFKRTSDSTIPEEEKYTIPEETTTHNKASVCIEDENNPTGVEATDYASER